MAITAPIAPLQTPVQKAHLKATVTGTLIDLKGALPKDIVSIHFLWFVKNVSISQYIKVSMPIIKYPPLALKKFDIYAGISISAFPWLDKIHIEMKLRFFYRQIFTQSDPIVIS